MFLTRLPREGRMVRVEGGNMPVVNMEDGYTRAESIGGFFGLELPVFENFPQCHGVRSVMLNSGRSSFEYILRSLGEISRLHLPYYTCSAVLEPVIRLGIPYSFYRIDERLEIDEACFPSVHDGELLLYTNYFGLKGDYSAQLARVFKGRLVLDHCMALYENTPCGTPAFYSPRKWSGLPDGGVAVLDSPAWQPRQADESFHSAGFLLQALENGVADAAGACEIAEERLRGAPVMGMSLLTRRLIRGIDYAAASRKRRENFLILHERLSKLNKLSWEYAEAHVPFCYPLWTNLPELRNHLIDHGILIPLLWADFPSAAPLGGVEEKLARGLLPLPVDQRYSREDMEKVLGVVESFYS